MTNSEFNILKIDTYCKLACYAESYIEKRKYSIKDCSDMLNTLILASAMFDSVCRLCINEDDENYCFSDIDDIEKIMTYIRNSLRIKC